MPKVRVESSFITNANATATWILNLPTASAVTHKSYNPSTDAFVETRTVNRAVTYKTNTDEVLTDVNFSGISNLQTTLANTYTLNGTRDQLTSQMVSGTGFTSRTTSYTERTVDGRVVTDTTFPLTTLKTSSTPSLDVDYRFASLYAFTTTTARETGSGSVLQERFGF